MLASSHPEAMPVKWWIWGVENTPRDDTNIVKDFSPFVSRVVFFKGMEKIWPPRAKNNEIDSDGEFFPEDIHSGMFKQLLKSGRG